jgi:integrase
MKEKLKQAKLKYNSENVDYIENEKVTLDQYFISMSRRQLRNGEIKESTAFLHDCRYRNHISPELGTVRVQQISRRMIENFQAKLLERTKDDYKGEKRKLSISTCREIITFLKSILNNAVRDEVITINPANGVKLPRNTGEKAIETTHRALDKEEQAIFFEAAKSNYYYEFMAIMRLTGMRQGEVSALTMADVDFKKNIINVNKTIAFDSKGKIIITPPKAEASKRKIAMNQQIIETLNAQLEKRQAILNNRAVISIDTPIFITTCGGRVHNDYINRAITNILAELEADGKHLEPFTSHAFRDTFATDYLEQRRNLKSLQKILGHAKFSMTADLYAHVLDDTQQEEMQKVHFIV